MVVHVNAKDDHRYQPSKLCFACLFVCFLLLLLFFPREIQKKKGGLLIANRERKQDKIKRPPNHAGSGRAHVTVRRIHAFIQSTGSRKKGGREKTKRDQQKKKGSNEQEKWSLLFVLLFQAGGDITIIVLVSISISTPKKKKKESRAFEVYSNPSVHRVFLCVYPQ